MKGTALTDTEAVPRRSYRDERREDQRVAAQIRRDDQAARAQAARDDAVARVKTRAAANKARQDRRSAARKARAAAVAAAWSWVARHLMDLMFVPVITVPGALAWEAMAAYGHSLWGPLGVILPAFSEGAMWAFDIAVEVRRHREPDKPVRLLLAGMAVFAAYGAVLNFLHGMARTTAHHGITTAIAMALVSVAGVTARQMITARRMTRIERRTARKIRKAQRDAVDRATVDLHAPGGPRLVMTAEPSPEPVAEPSEPAVPEPSDDGPRPVTVSVTKSAFGTLALTFTPAVKIPSVDPSPEPVKPQATPPVEPSPEAPGTDQGTTPPDPSRRPRRRPGPQGAGTPRGRHSKLDALIGKGGLPNKEIAKQARVSVSTVERRRRELREAAEAATKVTVLDERRHA
jgi:hypothetical protein